MVKIEVLCDSVRDCIVANKNGASRIELNNGTMLGGLTPSLGTLIMAKKNVSIPIVTMVRSRTAGFCYSDLEFEHMLLDATLLLENGADGIVFGFLHEDATLDVTRTQIMTELAKGYGKEAIFHRAFDNVKDPYETIEKLIEIGVDRILTSGLEPTADLGTTLLKSLIDTYGDRIEILPGGGVTKDNAVSIIEATGANQIHGSFKEWVVDPTSLRYGDTRKHIEDYFQVEAAHLKSVAEHFE